MQITQGKRAKVISCRKGIVKSCVLPAFYSLRKKVPSPVLYRQGKVMKPIRVKLSKMPAKMAACHTVRCTPTVRAKVMNAKEQHISVKQVICKEGLQNITLNDLIQFRGE